MPLRNDDDDNDEGIDSSKLLFANDDSKMKNFIFVQYLNGRNTEESS